MSGLSATAPGQVGKEEVSFGRPKCAWISRQGLPDGRRCLVGRWLVAAFALAPRLRHSSRRRRRLATLLMLSLVLAVWRRPNRSAAFVLDGINMLLLALLLLLSPNHEWYFLLVMPFVALCGNAPTWAATVGAILLTIETDFHISTLLVKSVLFGSVLLSALLSLRTARASEA